VANLSVQIVRFVDGHQPGWVACEFKDAEGRQHTLIDKVPIFTSEDLKADSAFPKPGRMPCEILGRWRDANGRELVRISTEKPLDNKSAEGLSVFVVSAAEISG
jgi:hypothetical protein